MKRIWFTQQRQLNCSYLPLRWGLGTYTDKQINKFSERFKPDAPDHPRQYCPKIYTSRLRPMQGEYYVVDGSRFKAKPVEPRIEFEARCYGKLWLKFRNGRIDTAVSGFHDSISLDGEWYEGYSFPELDLGVCGTTFGQLRDELLRLNPKATIDTPFYVNRLERVNYHQTSLVGSPRRYKRAYFREVEETI